MRSSTEQREKGKLQCSNLVSLCVSLSLCGLAVRHVLRQLEEREEVRGRSQGPSRKRIAGEKAGEQKKQKVLAASL